MNIQMKTGFEIQKRVTDIINKEILPEISTSIPEVLSEDTGIFIILVIDIDLVVVERLYIDKLKFEVKTCSSDITYRDQNYSSVSYVYTCHSEDRLANHPDGSYSFVYKNQVYTYTIPPNAKNELKSYIVEVFLLCMDHL